MIVIDVLSVYVVNVQIKSGWLKQILLMNCFQNSGKIIQNVIILILTNQLV